ncbi:MAG: HAD family hydrolase [bacterium]
MIRACAFDVGNTLSDDARLVEEVISDLAAWLRGKGAIPSERDFIDAYMRANYSTFKPFISHTFGETSFFEDAFAELGVSGISPDEALAHYRDLMAARFLPDPCVIRAFRFLRSKGIKIAILSNERVARVDVFVERTGIRKFLDAIVVSEEVGFEKPDPEIFRAASRRLGVPCPEIAVFGDNEIADGGGKRLGMKFVLVAAHKNPRWGWEVGEAVRPDYIIRRIDEDEMRRCLEAISDSEFRGNLWRS